MSDRRPENRPLFVGCPTHPEHADRKHDYMGNLSNYGDPCSFQLEPATPADLLAAVRRGVESGTIKGMVEKRHNGMHVPSEHAPDACSVHCVFADYLVVGPVSDGGSET